MKQLFFLVFLLPLAVSAQDCKVKKTVDKFSQEPKYSSGFMHFSTDKGEKVSLSIEADSKEVRLLFSLPGNCFNDQSTAAVTFEGSKTKSTMKNTSAMNCDGIFTVVFRNTATTPGALQKITNTQLSSILFTGSNKQKIELFLTLDEKNNLLEKASCLVTEAKELIK